MNECIFCKIINGEIPSYTIYEDNELKVFLDINPFKTGHMLIVPKKHITDYFEIDDKTLSTIMNKARDLKPLIYDKLHADGIKLVNNYGCEQAVKHYHMHVIPCYEKEQPNLSVEEVFNIYTK